MNLRELLGLPPPSPFCICGNRKCNEYGKECRDCYRKRATEKRELKIAAFVLQLKFLETQLQEKIDVHENGKA
jgi:hypothetical protein